MYPSYFYDCIEKNKDLSLYTSKINQYEVFLNSIYYYISTKTKLPIIDWLIKK